MAKIRKNKVIIYSFTQLSRQVAKTLEEKFYKILIIEEDQKRANLAKELGYDIVSLSLLEDKNIIETGICNDDAKAFFCLNDDNNDNLYVTLSVRNLNKEIKIVSLSSDKQTDKAMFLAGANRVINPFDIGAIRIARLLHKPLILKVIDEILFKEKDIDIEEITIEPKTIFDGIYLDDLKRIKNKDIIILGIQDKELSDKFIFFSTGINHKIDAGDTLVVLGKFHHLKKFRKELSRII
jgi:voltage-gated potassium channel